MTGEIVVTILGAVSIAGVAWFFWGPRRGGTRASVGISGRQEATVRVKGGYFPDALIVQAGRPVTLTFHREESSPCSEMVVFEAFGKSAFLPEGEDVAVEFLPQEPGSYEFTCQMGMLRGRLLVEAAAAPSAPRR